MDDVTNCMTYDCSKWGASPITFECRNLESILLFKSPFNPYMMVLLCFDKEIARYA